MCTKSREIAKHVSACVSDPCVALTHARPRTRAAVLNMQVFPEMCHNKLPPYPYVHVQYMQQELLPRLTIRALLGLQPPVLSVRHLVLYTFPGKGKLLG